MPQLANLLHQKVLPINLFPGDRNFFRIYTFASPADLHFIDSEHEQEVVEY
jgi:hypothetical protein